MRFNSDDEQKLKMAFLESVIGYFQDEENMKRYEAWQNERKVQDKPEQVSGA